MGDLSKYFSAHELACPCCQKCLIKSELLVALDALREAIGQPVHPTSGYRCPQHNAEVGGVTYSQHLGGTAADIVVYGVSPVEVAHFATAILMFSSGGIGLYPPWVDNQGRRHGNFVHVDIRGHFARWGKYMDTRVSYAKALHIFGRRE